MHLFKKSLTKAAILSAPFALAFTLSACEDSGTDSDGTNTPGTSEGTENGEGTNSGERERSGPCDFDINDPEWTFSFLDVGGTRTMTFRYANDTTYFLEVDTYDDDRPCDVDTSGTTINDNATASWSWRCVEGKMVTEDTTVYAEGYYTREYALQDAKNSCENFTVEGPKNRAQYEESLKENEQSTAE